MRYMLVYVTTGSRDEALRIARAVIEDELVACANILPAMTSVYRWQGTLEQSDEAVLLLKTRTSLVPQLTERVIALHSYDCPCVVSLPIEGGHSAFLQWIDDQTTTPSH